MSRKSTSNGSFKTSGNNLLLDPLFTLLVRTPYEVLKAFPSVKVPLDHFLEGLVKMQPRYYSISSSPTLNPGRVHITAVVVDYITPTKRRARGVVTSWLQDRFNEVNEGKKIR